MKISARNKFSATVTNVDKGVVSAHISLFTYGRVNFSSVVTLASVKDMALQPGDTVTVFFKASHVMLSTHYLNGISARNQLEGTVEEVIKGMVNMEITIVLEGGEHIVSTITHEAAKELGLLPGQKVVAIVKSTDIMIIKNEKENQ
jgi:molybdate transport system regulatory protein